MDFSSIITNQEALGKAKYVFKDAESGKDMPVDDYMNVVVHDMKLDRQDDSYSSIFNSQMRDFIGGDEGEKLHEVSKVLDEFIESDSLLSHYPSEVLDKPLTPEKNALNFIEKPVSLVNTITKTFDKNKLLNPKSPRSSKKKLSIWRTSFEELKDLKTSNLESIPSLKTHQHKHNKLHNYNSKNSRMIFNEGRQRKMINIDCVNVQCNPQSDDVIELPTPQNNKKERPTSVNYNSRLKPINAESDVVSIKLQGYSRKDLIEPLYKRSSKPKNMFKAQPQKGPSDIKIRRKSKGKKQSRNTKITRTKSPQRKDIKFDTLKTFKNAQDRKLSKDSKHSKKHEKSLGRKSLDCRPLSKANLNMVSKKSNPGMSLTKTQRLYGIFATPLGVPRLKISKKTLRNSNKGSKGVSILQPSMSKQSSKAPKMLKNIQKSGPKRGSRLPCITSMNKKQPRKLKKRFFLNSDANNL
ncbi:unnamed protein product [Moneuplotes crassus]|uniref:Uncharacterized protein n=1 Tax=Euplotes crassus TaxID=5936 RepID=A0AAD1UGQ6_EUPCR|nr:unnamed protein product [Moneuplotes crassus]